MATPNTTSTDGRGQRVLYIPYYTGARHYYRNPWDLFLRMGPFNVAQRISWNPYQSFDVMIDEDEFWDHGRAMSPALQHSALVQYGTTFPSPHNPWELFMERLLMGPFNISHRMLLSPYHQSFHMMMDAQEFWNQGRAMSPILQHFVRASPIRFSNRFDDDYDGRQLTTAQVEIVMEKVKTEVYRPLSKNSEEGNKEKEESDPTPHTCSICLDDFSAEQQLLCLPCKHRFHSECLMPWIKQRGQCPVCRLDLTGRPGSVNNANQPQNVNIRWS